MKIIYENLPKSKIIKAYRKKLKESGAYTNRYNTSDCEASLKRPNVMGFTMSWVDFRRLPREMVAMHCFMVGLEIEGIQTVGDEEE
jgi:hypothetical protein|tara:strand:- start:6389 stop:6646 length:258 start_codon:yes stop_codon:yes gene_type:complete